MCLWNGRQNTKRKAKEEKIQKKRKNIEIEIECITFYFEIEFVKLHIRALRRPEESHTVNKNVVARAAGSVALRGRREVGGNAAVILSAQHILSGPLTFRLCFPALITEGRGREVNIIW